MKKNFRTFGVLKNQSRHEIQNNNNNNTTSCQRRECSTLRRRPRPAQMHVNPRNYHCQQPTLANQYMQSVDALDDQVVMSTQDYIRLQRKASNVCLHAPYVCTEHRPLRRFWCEHCISKHMFPELHGDEYSSTCSRDTAYCCDPSQSARMSNVSCTVDPRLCYPAIAPGCSIPATAPRCFIPATAPECFTPATAPVCFIPATAPGRFIPATAPGRFIPATAPGCSTPPRGPCAAPVLSRYDDYGDCHMSCSIQAREAARS